MWEPSTTTAEILIVIMKICIELTPGGRDRLRRLPQDPTSQVTLDTILTQL